MRRRPFPPLPPLLLLPLLVLSSCFTPQVHAADRLFTITNSCTETIWTAITNYGEHSTYTGSRGFVQESGNVTEVTIPSPWNGRIWPRRKCEFGTDGTGKCVTGDCQGKLECEDQTIGTVNVGEFNLDSWGGNDFWDQSCVPGWTIPMLIEPQGDGCDSVSCTQDVNAACPDDRMKVKDDDGNTLACIAACFAGINAADPSMNCCSGKYNDLDACVSDQVDFYSVLKPLCEHAYWYPYDSRPNYPTVDYACPSSGDPGYKIEYCPDGSGTGMAVGKDGAAAASKSAAKETGLASPIPSGTGGLEGGKTSGTGGKGEDNGSTSDSSAKAKATGGGGSSGGGTASSTSSPKSGSSSSSNSDSATSSDSTTDKSDDSTMFGLSTPIFFSLISVVVVGLFLLVSYLFIRKKQKPTQTAATRSPDDTSSSDSGTSSDSSDEDQGPRGDRKGALRLLIRPWQAENLTASLAH
ncbi:hypothetical protein JCM11641_003660 [Rhodosporidiobolus odoratus]